MVFLFEGVVGLGLALLTGLALAEWGKFRNKAEKGFNLLALGGVWFLFSGATSVAAGSGGFPSVASLASQLTAVSDIFGIIGWIFALIGTLFAAYEVLVEK